MNSWRFRKSSAAAEKTKFCRGMVIVAMMVMIIIIIIISMRSAVAAEYFPIYVSWRQRVGEALTLFGVPYCQDGL